MMNREILFRGKRVDGKGWVYGSAVLTYGDGVFISTGELYSNNGRDWRIVAVEVIPETVAQFTGLTDKNGRKIFEGDVLTGCGEVFWDNNIENCGCCNKIVAAGFDFGDLPANLQVTGNIHD